MNQRKFFSHIFVGGCALSLILCGCTQSNLTSSQISENDSTQSGQVFACEVTTSCANQSESGDLSQLDAALATFTPMDFESAISFFQEGKSGVLYFGFYDCPWCQDVVPILSDVAAKNGGEVFYVQTRDAQRQRLYTDEQKERIVPYLGNYMSENNEGVLTLYVPLIVRVQDGKVTMAHQGTVDGHQAGEREMSEEERLIVNRAIQNMFE